MSYTMEKGKKSEGNCPGGECPGEHVRGEYVQGKCLDPAMLTVHRSGSLIGYRTLLLWVRDAA